MRFRVISSIILTTILIGVLLLGVSELPEFGSSDIPAHNEVMERYNEKSIEETHAYNVVTAIVLDYRGFDTLIEATVLFCAVISILVTLTILGDEADEKSNTQRS
jgi:multicomponent Na+:H+ antiporter subunit B